MQETLEGLWGEIASYHKRDYLSPFLGSCRVRVILTHPPSSLLNPKRVQLCSRAEVVGTWCRSQLPTLKEVRGAC